MCGKRVILTGATGMVGGLALEKSLGRSDVSAVTVIGRRSTGVTHEKLREVIHTDFADFSKHVGALRDHDLALYCLGAYTGAVPDDDFRRITVDYSVAFARYKGAAEKALLDAGFPRVHLFRPGYIHPIAPRREPNHLYGAFRTLYPILRLVYPNIGISSVDLARAMVEIGLGDAETPGPSVLENRDIRAWIANRASPAI